MDVALAHAHTGGDAKRERCAYQVLVAVLVVHVDLVPKPPSQPAELTTPSAAALHRGAVIRRQIEAAVKFRPRVDPPP